MNFALLGDADAAYPLLDAVRSAGHSVVRAALADQLIAAHPELASVAKCGWEVLLVDSMLDAVIVAGDSDEVQFAAKQLAAAGKPLLVVPRVSFGDGCAYELSLIRDDSHIELMPAFGHRGDPELAALSQRLRHGECGVVRRLQIDRELLTSSNASGLTEDEIEATSLLDIDVLHWLGGRYDQVTALRSGQSEQGCSQATLTLAGTNLPDATWTARRGSASRWRLTIETDREPITIERSDPPSAPAALVAAFAARTPPNDLTWADAVRVFDVLDAARRSWRRRRTIDLHNEILSERQQFKTQMTAIGCGMLLLTLVLMLALLGLGSLLESRDRTIRDAAASGLLIAASEFEPGTTTLTSVGQSRLSNIADRMQTEPKSVYLEPVGQPPNPELDQQRRRRIAQELAAHGVEAADHRTLIAPAKSSGWETVLRILRLAWIAPLVLFLLLQGLILVARPGRQEHASANKH